MMIHKKLRTWKTLSKHILLDHGRFLKVEEHRVELPDGQVIPDWTWVIIPDAAIVLAMTGKDEFLLFRQRKYAINGVSLAPVGGMIEPGERPLAAARRELLEEMGYESEEWINLGNYVLDPNRHVAKVHLFLALNARKIADPANDDLEDQELLILHRDELSKALFSGQFKEITWSAVVSLALNYLTKMDHDFKEVGR